MGGTEGRYVAEGSGVGIKEGVGLGGKLGDRVGAHVSPSGENGLSGAAEVDLVLKSTATQIHVRPGRRMVLYPSRKALTRQECRQLLW